ncbi:MAG: hypothetical protein D6815_03495 [Candidatus Dadabacteria bacterium]|nr:MAG: hypothetical protein D6815_03495 [Candidatus Dadabacteria bacterium]
MAPLPAPTEDGDLAPFFVGEPDRVAFVTAQPQAPDASGLALVEYRLEEDRLVMSERPYYAILDQDFELDKPDVGTLETTLLFDVKELRFRYRRSDFDEADWSDEWDAAEEEELPAVVAIEIVPSAEGGPAVERLVPVFVGVYNELTGEEDFRRFG